MAITSEKLVQIVTDGDMSADVTSSSVNVQKDVNCAIQAKFTGSSPTGTFHLLASNDDITYTTINSADVAITTSGDVLWNITAIGFAYLKLYYEFGSGTGTLNATLFIKETY